MLFKIAGYLLWVPALLGLGSLIFRWIGRKVPVERDFANFAFIGVAGFMVLGVIATVLNFFMPIAPPIPLMVLIIGWVLFVVNRRQLQAAILPDVPYTRLRLVFLFGLLVIFTAYYTQRGFVLLDAGWYYFPSLKWIAENPLAVGIANLNSRMGYNYQWFPIAAMMELFDTAHQSSLMLNGLLLLLFAMVVWEALTRKRSEIRRASDIFMMLSVFAWFTIIIFSPKEISAFTPNLPVAILALLSTYAVLRAFEDKAQWLYYFVVVMLLALFGVLIKISAVMLGTAILILAIYQWRTAHVNKALFAEYLRKLVIIFGPIVLVMVTPWLLRGVALSGCLAYPVGQTCVRSLAWTVSPQVAQGEVDGILSWSRQRWVDRSVTLGSWAWLPGWWADTISQPRVLLLLVPLVIGAGLWIGALFWSKPKRFPGQGMIWAAMLPSIAACVLWFFTAPDFKYIYGSFASLTQLFLTGAIVAVLANRPQLVGQLPRLQWRIANVVAIGLTVWILAKSGQAVIQRNRDILLAWPETGEYVGSESTSKNGESVLIAKDLFCWNAPIPCADHDVSDVIISRDSRRFITSVVRDATP